MTNKLKLMLANLLNVFYNSYTGSVGTNNKATRDRWLKETLGQISPGARILDAGAGQLQYKPFCNHLNYVSQDFAEYNGYGDGAGLQTKTWEQSRLSIVSDITSIPEPDSSFDAIMCIEVLEHVPDPVAALREFTRLLKTNGVLIITAPFCSLTHYSPYFFYTGYSRYFYEYWLKEFRYEIENMEWNGNYFEYLAQELRRFPSISEQYAHLKPKFYERLLTSFVLKILDRCTKLDKSSHELLTFGIHVRARKL